MFITFGDIYINYYFKNNLLDGVSLGKSNCIILANLSSYYKCKVLGVIGNNSLSNIALLDLGKLNIDHSNLQTIDEDIKGLFIQDNITDICPYCNRKYSYEGSLIDVDNIINNINPEDIIIVDNLSDETIEVINNIDNEMYLDLGNISSIKYMDIYELEELSGKFKIINIDAKVYGYLKSKFKIDSRDLYNILNPDILIVYKGINGCDILTKDDITTKEMEGKNNNDMSGAREAFFAEFIHEYLSYKEIDDKVISNIFIKSFSKLLFVSNHNGPLTHLIPLNKVKNYHECICKDIDI